MLAQQMDQVVVCGDRRRGNRSDLALFGQLIDDFNDAIALQNVVVLGDGMAGTSRSPVQYEILHEFGRRKGLDCPPCTAGSGFAVPRRDCQ